MRHGVLLSVVMLLGQAPSLAAQDAGALPHLGTATLSAGQGQVTLAAGAQAGAAVTVLLPDPAGGGVTVVSGHLGAALAPAGDDRPAFALADPGTNLSGVGFAITGPLPALQIAGSTIRADLDGDGTPEVMALCLTQEGVALRVTPEGADAPLWEDYVALGYDVEPTCP